MKFVLLSFLFLFSFQTFAKKISVITTTTDLAWVAKKIGRDKVKVESLLRGTEDAHYLDAKPSYIRKVSNADVVCFNGLALEVGWLPKVLSKSGNAKVQSGGKGHCDASAKVEVIEKLTGRVDRSMGDVHPEGNPHYSLSPLRMAEVSRSVMRTLVRVDRKNAKFYLANYKQLSTSLKKLYASLKKRFAKFSGTPVLQYHKEFSYYLQTYGLKGAGALEPVPGVPPSAGRLQEVAVMAQADGVKLALAASYAPKKLISKFEKVSGVPALMLPVYLPKTGKLSDYFAFQKHLANQVLSKLQ